MKEVRRVDATSRSFRIRHDVVMTSNFAVVVTVTLLMMTLLLLLPPAASMSWRGDSNKVLSPSLSFPRIETHSWSDLICSCNGDRSRKLLETTCSLRRNIRMESVISISRGGDIHYVSCACEVFLFSILRDDDDDD